MGLDCLFSKKTHLEIISEKQRVHLGRIRLGRMRYAPTANFDNGMKMIGHNDKFMKNHFALSYVDGV